MAAFMGLQDISKNPMSLIAIVIGLIVLVNIATVGLPLIIVEFASLAGLGNFSFAGLFADDGVGEIVIGALILIAVLSMLGIKAAAGRSGR